MFLLGELLLEADGHGCEDDEDEFLQAETADVDVETVLFRYRHALLVGHGTASRLDEEGEDVETDEDRGEMLGFDTVDSALIQEEVNHPAEEHVDEGVDPQRRKEDE